MASTLSISCVRPGGGAFVVDGGRPGYRHLGVCSGGPADGRAMAAANALLNRAATAPCLELTLASGTWLISGQGQLAITGADMNWRLNGQLLDPHSVLYLDGDALLTGTNARKGLRSYLAIRGDWDLPLRLGSREAGLPGMETIAAGWSATVTAQGEAPYQSDLNVGRFWPEETTVVPVIAGPEYGLLPSDMKRWLEKTIFTVGRDSNRQGLRLLSEAMPNLGLAPMISSPVLPGTIQLSPAGPIFLGPDAQTIGGYPRVFLVEDPEMSAAAFQVEIGGKIILQKTDEER